MSQSPPGGAYMSEAARTLGIPYRATEDVLRHMLGHPDRAYTPLALGTAIKRHATTVSQAFRWLVDQGWVEAVGTGNRRKFHLTKDGAAAAAMLVEAGAPPKRVTRKPGDRVNPHPGRWGSVPSEQAQAVGIMNGSAEKILRWAYDQPRGTRLTTPAAAVVAGVQRTTAVRQLSELADAAWLIRKQQNPAVYVLAGRPNPFAEPEPAQLELAVAGGGDVTSHATPVVDRPLSVDPPSWGFPLRNHQNRWTATPAADTDTNSNGETDTMTSITREPIDPEPEPTRATNGTAQPERREGLNVWFSAQDRDQLLRVAQKMGWTPQQVARRGVGLVDLVADMADTEELAIRDKVTGELFRVRLVWAD